MPKEPADAGRLARPEGVPLMIVKKLLTHFMAIRSVPYRPGSYAGQLNLAQMVRPVCSPSIPHSVANVRMMSSP